MALTDTQIRAQQDAYLFIYLNYLPKLRERGKELGYAITVHGSMTRDFDLVAIPWTEEASSQEDLVQAFNEVIGGGITHLIPIGKEEKPHGRTAYNISLGAGMYLDLSIIDLKK